MTRPYKIFPNADMGIFDRVEVRPEVRRLVADLAAGYRNWDWRRIRAQVQYSVPDASREEVLTALERMGEKR